MKKVLQISMGDSFFGGLEKLEIEYMKYLNEKFKIDVLTPNDIPFKKYQNEIKKYKGNSYNLNTYRKTRKEKLIYDLRLIKFLKNNKYDIVHVNSDIFFFTFRIALISKICGVKHIIVHSHGYWEEKGIKGLLIKILNPLYRVFIDEYLTCSMKAAESLYTKKFINKNKVKLLKNGIEVEKYRFSSNLRIEYRNQMNMEDKIVYGHVGRFGPEKNHTFLIELFYEIQKEQKNAILLLLGDGELEQQIKNKVKNLGIEDKVIFLGFKENINEILNAIDIFVFPSLHEGLGIAAIEAQTNGLITYCSDNIPKEANISPCFKKFSLNEKLSNIAEKICNENINIENRENAYKYTIENGYDIKDVCKELEKIYNSF